MQNDSVIWECINRHGCKYKVVTRQKSVKNFCRNPCNISGLCGRSQCPLANSRYATIREEKGICYLWMKTIERAHMPNRLWEKVALPKDYKMASLLITENLILWPKKWRTWCKRRMTRIHQYLIRMRKLALENRPKMVTIQKKVERRERTRERKALKAANINKAITDELINRLESKTYGELYNFPQREYEEALDVIEEKAETEMENEIQKEVEEEEDVEYVADFGESGDDDDGSDFDDEAADEMEEELDAFMREHHQVDDNENDEFDDDDDDHDDYVDEDDGDNDGDDDDGNDDDDDGIEVPEPSAKKKRRLTKSLSSSRPWVDSSKKTQGKEGKKTMGRKRIEIEYEQEQEREQLRNT